MSSRAYLHNTPTRLALTVLPGRLAVVRMAAEGHVRLDCAGPFMALARTADELSIVCAEANAPDGSAIERGFRAIQVRGQLDFSLVGILARLTDTLAVEGVSVFVVSTFLTDYLLVRDEDLGRALKAFAAAGHTLSSEHPGEVELRTTIDASPDSILARAHASGPA